LGSKRIFSLAAVLTCIGVAPACANLIGLSDFGVGGGAGSASVAGSANRAGAETSSEAGSAGDSGSADAGGNSTASGGSAGTSGSAGSGGAACPNDCNDKNECTDDSCVNACNVAADCASDGVNCTNETCTNHVCSHVADDSKCAASGDQCMPNRCDAALDCKKVDITAASKLIQAASNLGNGSFEAGTDMGTAVGWTDSGDDYVIYNCLSPGCIGSAGTTLMAAGDGNLLAWFGGTKHVAVDQIDHLIHLPLGVTKLSIQADTNVQTKSIAASNKDVFEIRLLDSSVNQAQIGAAIVSLSNVNAQTTTPVWTTNGINQTVDVSAQADKDVYLRLWSSVDAALTTDFFIDNVRVTATVCK
jgi:hypothetical protein